MCTFVLRPNQSLSWRQAKLLYAGMVAFSGTIALGFAAMGYWPILPFAGLELLLLGVALYVSQSQGQRAEVISLHRDHVVVDKGRRGPEQHWEFNRAWLQIRLQQPRTTGYPSRLLLRAHGRQVVIGEFLPEEERREVARELRKALALEAGSTDAALTHSGATQNV